MSRLSIASALGMCVVLALCISLVVPVVATPTAVLRRSWENYKKHFVQDDGRVIEWNRGEITTSEGQAYAMLRSVWANDRDTFERTRSWAASNLRVRDDRLYAWKWGKRDDGSWGVLDTSSASDADQDAAHALILAARKWRVPAYTSEAKELLSAVWSGEVVQTQIGPLLTAGSWAPAQERPTINPSYLSPAAYRLFAEVDPAHSWGRMVDSTYTLLERAAALSTVGLVPDWCAVEPATGKVTPAETFPNGAQHSYDAWRVAWRLALDAKSRDGKARKFIEGHRYVFDLWKRTGRVPDALAADGTAMSNSENVAIYGAYIAAFAIIDKKSADKLYDSRLAGGDWGDPKDYYAQNLVWMGLAVWSGAA